MPKKLAEGPTGMMGSGSGNSMEYGKTQEHQVDTMMNKAFRSETQSTRELYPSLNYFRTDENPSSKASFPT